MNNTFVKIRVCLIYWVFPLIISAQKTDSLENLLRTNLNDTARLKILNEVGKTKCLSGDYNKALLISNEAISRGEKSIQDNLSAPQQNSIILLALKRETGNAYNIKGITYWYLGNYPASLESHFRALKKREEIGDKRGISSSYNNIGIVYNNQGNNSDALKNYFEALKIAEELNDKNKIASFYNNIGNVNAREKNFKEALKYQQLALKIYEEQGDKPSMALTYGNIAGIFYELTNHKAALENYNKAVQLKEELGDKRGLGINDIGIGGVYIALNDNEKAISYLKEGLKIVREFGLKEWVSSAYLNLSFAYDHKGLKENNSKEDFTKAFEYYKLHIQYRDSLLNEENTKKTVQQQLQYEFDKKETLTKAEQDKKDLGVAEEKEKQKIITVSILACLVLVMLLALVILKSLRQNQKINKIITGQKMVVEKQKELVEEKQKEILDSIHYARRIQTALITSEKYIEKNLNRLNNLK